jgi:hypothetical protein
VVEDLREDVLGDVCVDIWVHSLPEGSFYDDDG